MLPFGEVEIRKLEDEANTVWRRLRRDSKGTASYDALHKELEEKETALRIQTRRLNLSQANQEKWKVKEEDITGLTSLPKALTMDLRTELRRILHAAKSTSDIEPI